MSEWIKVAVDAMGGDNAPVETVKGAVEAVNESGKIKVYLVGKQDILERSLPVIHIRRSRLRWYMPPRSSRRRSRR